MVTFLVATVHMFKNELQNERMREGSNKKKQSSLNEVKYGIALFL
jgi:hypothetical protein